jgi:benzoate/toluate 1,2-dioxygenase reductase subunit
VTVSLSARIARWQKLSDHLAIIGLEADRPFDFEPGQYATLSLPDQGGRAIKRPMSIASPAGDLSIYEFLVRHVEDGPFTSLLWARTIGDRIGLTGPKGRFVLQADDRACVFVAGGTGLAPFASMIRTLALRNETRDIVLLHGVSREGDLAWRAELERIAATGKPALRYVPTVSRPGESPGWNGLTGRVESILAGQLDAAGLGPANATLYACGNPEMVEAVKVLAGQRGFDRRHVLSEKYWVSGQPA